MLRVFSIDELRAPAPPHVSDSTTEHQNGNSNNTDRGSKTSGLRRALVRVSGAQPSEWVVMPLPRHAGADAPRLCAVEATCPHSGGPLHLGDIEDLADANSNSNSNAFVVCPWHEFRFSLADGACENASALRAETALVSVDRLGEVSLAHPSLDGAVVASVDFFDQPTRNQPDASSSVDDAAAAISSMRITDTNQLSHSASNSPEPPEALTHVATEAAGPDSAPSETACISLVDYAITILHTSDPDAKVKLTHKVAGLWAAGAIASVSGTRGWPVPDRPARHAGLGFVDPAKTKRRGKGGSVESRISILHSLANIEQWAIDLAWDMIARFADTKTDDAQQRDSHGVSLPHAFFTDFVRMASEEATHFTLLVGRINDLGSFYGALPVHGGLWDSAIETKNSLAARLAVVHMVHEARGLDINPQTIEKFQRAGDTESVARLERIHSDEITHVASGHRWFSWICALTGDERYERFHELVRKYFYGPLRPPFNDRDRLLAGLDTKYYLPLSVSK